MDQEPSNAELWTLLQEQRKEIERLKTQLAGSRSETGPSSNGHRSEAAANRRFSRAGLLKAAAAGVAGVAAAEVAGGGSAPLALADDAKYYYAWNFHAQGGAAAGYAVANGTISEGGASQYDTGFAVLGGVSASATGFSATPAQGEHACRTGFGGRGTSYGVDVDGGNTGVRGTGGVYGVWGETSNGNGSAVQGFNSAGYGWGVKGESYNPNGVAVGLGVEGISGAGIGVRGRATRGGTGVWGMSDRGDGTGVVGQTFSDDEKTLGSGYGVHGVTGSGTGVFGEARSNGTGVTGASYGDGGALGSGIGVHGASASGTAVLGEATGNGTGVEATSGTGVGLSASSSGTAVYGSSTGGYGVYGTSGSGSGIFASGHAQDQPAGYCVNFAQGTGVLGRSYLRTHSGRHLPGSGTGVAGESGSGIGVQGSALTGRGGAFAGGAAQVQLVPASDTTPPTTGQQGDLFLGSDSKLWLCTVTGTDHAAATWMRLGASAGGSGGGPLAGKSGNANPAVSGVNTDSGAGVKGSSATGRGAVFSGPAAQMQLVPAATNTPPKTGLEGDVFLGSDAKLWLCTVSGTQQTAATWVQLGPAGSGGGGPVDGESGDKNVPAVNGVNTAYQGEGVKGTGGGPPVNSQFLGAKGVEGASYGGFGVFGVSYDNPGANPQPGPGFGVFGVTGSGVGVYGSVANSLPGVGVHGEGGTVGVSGFGVRGASFTGSKSQLQLVPSPVNGHPVDGEAGDLFVDTQNVLYFCTATGNPATWKKVQLV